MKKYIFLFTIFVTNLLYANQNIADELAKVSQRALFELDDIRLKETLTPYLKSHRNIEGVKVIDLISDEVFLQFYKSDNNLIFNKKIPKNIIDLNSYSAKIILDDEVIGKIVIYTKGNNNSIDFTKEERKWLLKHKEVIVGGEVDWAPFDFVKDGLYQGISKDILELIAKKINLKLSYKVGLSWKELIENFKIGKIDILPALYRTQDREEFTYFSKPYFRIKDYLFVRSSDSSIKSIDDLKDKKIAVIDGYAIEENLKNRFGDDIKLVKVKSLFEGIDKVLLKEADGYIDAYPVMMYVLSSTMQTAIKPIIPLNFYTNELHIGIRKSEPILASIIKKGLDSVTTEEKNRVYKKWMALEDNKEEKTLLNLSDDEKNWLNKKIPIKYVYDPEWAPFEWRDELGKHRGMLLDLIYLIKQKSNINFIEVSVNSWSEAIDKAKNREVDMFSGVAYTPKKAKYMNFTENSIFKTPYVFVVRANDKSDYFNTFDILENKRVAVVKGYAIHERLLNDKPNLKLLALKSVKDGFSKLQKSQIDVFIINATTAKYYINRLGFNELRIATKIDYLLDLKVAISSNFDKEALSIIDKAIGAISEKEISDIKHKWTEVIIQKEVNWLLISQILAVSGVILIAIIFHNIKLKFLIEKVREKTKELEIAKKSIEEIHKQTKSSIEYASLIQNSLIPDNLLFKKYFSDYFTIWQPKDIVGGDIYLFEELREDEILLMVVDCTGHGVPGAFVTMIVKAIERQITTEIINSKREVDTAKILSIFNISMKNLLKQDDDNTLSNVGFDGGVFYYNRKKSIVKYSNAKIPLFIIENNELKTIKGSRQSIGYKRSNTDFEFKEYTFDVKSRMKFYITTDGYIDQNGGKKGFPFSRKKFINIIEKSHKESFDKQKEILLGELTLYQGVKERNDDVTIIGIEI